MIKYLKYFLFTTASLVICNLFGQSVEPHFNPDEDSTHIIKIRKSDGTIEYFKHGVLINLDTSYKGEDFELADSFETNDSLKNSKYTLKNAPIFEYGIGKTDNAIYLTA